MTAILCPLMHNTIAESFYNSIVSKSSKYYYYLGRTLPYPNIVNGVEEVETPLSTYNYELAARRNMVYAKQMTPDDICFVVPRINWTVGITYDCYDDNYSTTNPASSGAISLDTAKFYVLTSAMNVYICLDNNYDAVSNVMPTGYSPSPFITADGYKWKFVMIIPVGLQIKFLTSVYMPISTSINSIFYNNGALDTIIVEEGGTGYTPNSVATISVNSDVIAAVNIVVGITYQINSIGTTDFKLVGAKSNTVGLAFTATHVGIGTGTVTGTGAIIEPLISSVDGSIHNINIVSSGSGYGAGTTLTINGKGKGVFNNNKTAILTPVIDAFGSIVYVVIQDPGTKYNDNYTTLVVQSETGTGAEVSAIIKGGQIVDVVIDNPGTGYRTANLTAFGNSIPNGDIPARFTVSTTGGILDTAQSNVEILAINGTIDFIKLSNQGAGYTSANIVISGDGTGALATPVIQNGNIIGISITNCGYDYTYATVSIEGINTTPASARAIISPKYGHGNNALHDLSAKTLMFYILISEDSNSSFVMNNDYRQFGIIRNPTQFDSRHLSYSPTETTCYNATGIVSNGIITNDMVLLDDNGNSYIVISMNKDSLLLQPYDNGVLLDGMVLTNGVIGFRITELVNPTIDKYSGDMLYIDNRTAFFQTLEQTLTFQTILQF